MPVRAILSRAAPRTREAKLKLPSCARKTQLMEVGSLQHLSDSFSYGWLTRAQAPPSFERLGSPRSSSFMDDDMEDDPELFSMRWATAPAPASDFSFGLPRPEEPPSPKMLVVSASQIFLPCSAAAQEDADCLMFRRALDAPSASASASPLFLSAQSTPVSMSSCSSARNSSNRAGRTSSSSSAPWNKVLLRCLRILMPLYRKVKALAPRHRVAPAATAAMASPARGVEWCHGNADTAVRDAILYCKKSSGQGVLP
ncbi:uncharacterized protein LOC100837960 [Brachypodium distachyon]|uniref:uncharacterized protein LOC100837960 n=1 Tax=Brachypodium distachyon TaxID=15368 RepID=UPI00052FF9E3|nr:uncharacterized protein LOC100837960 [Brachypodium distachyon]|eukprot:XP_003562162.4 uncharacterized protein LOC100837960 [Brachypodium distachyon]